MSESLSIPFRRSSDLADAGTLLGTDRVWIVRPGSPASPMRGQLSGVVDLVVPLAVPLVQATVGIQDGTVTGTAHTGGVTTYTYTSAVETPDFGHLVLILPETNQGAVQLARTGGATRGVLSATGNALAADQATPNELLVLQRRGSQFWIAKLDVIKHFVSRSNMTGPSATLDGKATRAQTSPLMRVGGFSAGAFWVQVGGNGVGGALQNALWVHGAPSGGYALGDFQAMRNAWFDQDVTIAGNLHGTLPGLRTQEATITGTDTSGGATTYTYSSPAEVPDFGRMTVVWPATNVGAVSLARTGGTTLPVLDANGTALTDDVITPGRTGVVQRRGSTFRVETLDRVNSFAHRSNLIGALATLDGKAARAQSSPLMRVGGFSTGAFWVQVGGDGNGGALQFAMTVYGAPSGAYGLGDGRFWNNLHIDGDVTVGGNIVAANLPTDSAKPFSPSNPPPGSDAIIQLMEEFGGTGAYESLGEAVSVPNTYPHQITPSDRDRHLWDNISGSFIDCGDMPSHSTKLIRVGTAGAVRIWTGEAVNWTDRTTQQVEVSRGRYRVHRGQGNEFEIEPVNGKTITDVSPALPVYNRRIAIIGYSNAIRTAKNIAGWRDQFLAWGEDPSVVNVLSGTGASPILRGGQPDPNYWWDWQTGLPGPNVDTFLAAVAAQPQVPTLECVVVHIGYADMNLLDAGMNPYGAVLTEQQIVDAYAGLFNHIKGPSGLNLPALKFMICPMAHRHTAAWAQPLWYAMRHAQLEVCAQHPSMAFRGPDSFDLRFIAQDGHPTVRSQAIFSARWARWMETAFGRKSAFRGPTRQSFVQDSPTQSRIIIETNGEQLTFPGRWGDVTNAPLPPCLALLPPGATWHGVSPIAISRCQWSFAATPTPRWTITLTHAAQANVRSAWPYGDAHEFGEDPALCIRSALTGEPLQTFHEDV